MTISHTLLNALPLIHPRGIYSICSGLNRLEYTGNTYDQALNEHVHAAVLQGSALEAEYHVMAAVVYFLLVLLRVQKYSAWTLLKHP